MLYIVVAATPVAPLMSAEKEVIIAYRNQPTMQEAVDRLLGIQNEDNVAVAPLMSATVVLFLSSSFCNVLPIPILYAPHFNMRIAQKNVHVINNFQKLPIYFRIVKIYNILGDINVRKLRKI